MTIQTEQGYMDLFFETAQIGLAAAALPLLAVALFLMSREAWRWARTPSESRRTWALVLTFFALVALIAAGRYAL